MHERVAKSIANQMQSKASNSTKMVATAAAAAAAHVQSVKTGFFTDAQQIYGKNCSSDNDWFNVDTEKSPI